MTYATNQSELLAYFKNLLEANKFDLGITDVWYEEQRLVPRTPSISLSSVGVTRELRLSAFPPQVKQIFIVYFIVYHQELQDMQLNYMQCLGEAEAVAKLLSQDTTCGGAVIFGMWNEIQPGYIRRANSVQRATRITWEGWNSVVVTAA